MSYCTSEDVNNLFGDISDDISDDMFATAIDNSTNWINSNLRKSFVPIPVIVWDEVTITDDGDVTEELVSNEIITSEETTITDENETTEETTTHTSTHTSQTISIPLNIPESLKTAAIYYAASDILLSLYHGETLPVQYDVWFQKAQDLLNAYITAELNYTDDTIALNKVTCVKHRKSKGYTRRL